MRIGPDRMVRDRGRRAGGDSCRLRSIQGAHGVHEGGVDEAGLAVVPVGVTVALILVQGLGRRFVDPPEVAPRVESARDPVAAVEVADGSHDAPSGRDGLVQAVLGIGDIDLQEGRREGPVGLAVAQHDRGVADRDLGMDDRAVPIGGADVGGFVPVEHGLHEADEAHGVWNDGEGVDGVVPGRGRQGRHVYIKYEYIE